MTESDGATTSYSSDDDDLPRGDWAGLRTAALAVKQLMASGNLIRAPAPQRRPRLGALGESSDGSVDDMSAENEAG